MLIVRASLSPSPIFRAFSHIEWNAPIAVSKPEQSLLQSAEEHPLEYILADFGDAFAYARVLLKILDQVTGPSNPGRVSFLALEVFSPSTNQPGLTEEEALEYLDEDKKGVVTHYIISQLYEMIGLLTEQPNNSNVQLNTIFYQNNRLLEDWRPLLRLLYRPGDPFSQRGAALCLAYILQAGCQSQKSTSLLESPGPTKKILMVEETLQSLISWLTSRLQASHSTSLGVVTPTLVVLSTCPLARIIFDNAGGIGYLARHLRPKNSIRGGFKQSGNSPAAATASFRRSTSNGSMTGQYQHSPPKSPNNGTRSSSRNSTNGRLSSISHYSNVSVQQLYELCFCLWTLTYECGQNESIQQHFSRDGAIPALAELVAAAPREKVVRLGLASLRNLAEAAPTVFIPEMIACRIFKSVELLKERQWSDSDIVQDLDALHKMLSVSYQELTKWEVYRAELESGQLSWGILHTEQFFKENARRMEGPKGDFCHVKRLIQLLVSNVSQPYCMDEDTVAIACFDLGEFARNYPNGKAVAKQLGAKQLVMSLIHSEHAEIQRQALLCISKMLVSNWQAVAGPK